MRSAQSTCELAGSEPVGDRNDERLLLVAEADREEGDPGQQRADAEQAGGDELGGARADPAAEQAGDQEAEQRQEDDQIDTCVAQPFITLMSSTAIEPRLR